MADACFQLKGATVTTLVLDLYQYHPDLFMQQLEAKVSAAPRLFAGSPLYINLGTCTSAPSSADLSEVVRRCRELQLEPFGCQHAAETLLPTLRELGLTALPGMRPRDLPPLSQEPAKSPSAAAAPVAAASATKVINRPVRSGQQVYAKGGDLILLAPVSEGAEIIADGNIHVYSTLRGRALAGVDGNTEARIFCQQLEAELVSIAGLFMLNDSVREHCWKQAAQIHLENESLHITAL